MTLLTFEKCIKTYDKSLLCKCFPELIGKIVGLLGPNGSGKTQTLIKLINGLLNSVGTRAYSDWHGMEPSPATKATCFLFTWYTTGLKRAKWRLQAHYFKTFHKDFNLERAQGLLRDLASIKNSRFKKLSKGNKESVQLDSVIGVDARLYIPVWRTNRWCRSRRQTIVFSTPRQQLLSNWLSWFQLTWFRHRTNLDEIIFLEDGKVVRQGNADDIRYESGVNRPALPSRNSKPR